MTTTTATVTSFQKNDGVAAKSAIETLNPGANDKLVFWESGSKIWVAKLVIA